jgi:hypothetical protein
MELEHYWKDSTVDDGKHLMGSAKVWVTNTEPTDAPSGSTMDATDTGHVWFNDSNGALTIYTGGNFVYPSYFDTDLNVTGDLTVGTNLDVGGTLTVTGNTTISGDITASGGLSVITNLDVSGTLTVAGAVDINSTISVSGSSTFSSGIGFGGTPYYRLGKFTGTLNGSGNASYGHGLTLSDIVSITVLVQNLNGKWYLPGDNAKTLEFSIDTTHFYIDGYSGFANGDYKVMIWYEV